MSIQEWLSSNRDYETGRQLYELHGKSNVLKKMFAQGSTVFNREKLLKELSGLVASALPPAVTAPPKTVIAPVPEPAIAEKTLGVTAQKLLTEKLRPLLDKRTMFHNQLSVVNTEAQRRELAFQILELSEALQPLWEQYNYAQKHGKLPEPPAPAELPTDKAELEKYMRNKLRPLISKLRKKPHRLNDLIAKEKELAEVERRLNDGKE